MSRMTSEGLALLNVQCERVVGQDELHRPIQCPEKAVVVTDDEDLYCQKHADEDY